MKILVIRFMGLGDVASILVPAVKRLKRQMPEAVVDVLTYGAGVELMQLMDEVHAVLGVAPEQWPGDLQPAMQSFAGIAEVVLAQGYDRIINLDTWFMPCFLARLLLDAGANVEGNYINSSIAEFSQRLHSNQLTQSYFEDGHFLASSYPQMPDWFNPLWTMDHGPWTRRRAVTPSIICSTVVAWPESWIFPCPSPSMPSSGRRPRGRTSLPSRPAVVAPTSAIPRLSR